MSAAVSEALVLGADIAQGDLDGLCKAIYRRIGREIRMCNDDRDWLWPRLYERFHRTMSGQTLLAGYVTTKAAHIALVAEFEADMRALLALPADRFRRCLEANATTPSGTPDAHLLLQHRQAQQVQAAALPRVQPREVLASLAARGITVQAIDNNLHVVPAELLGEADRALLVANKAALLDALAMPGMIL